MNRLAPWLSLFASTGTLICCALPSLLVVLGMGSVMVGLISTFPQVVWLSEYKALVFGLSGLMIAVSAYMHFRAKSLLCPSDQKLAQACTTSRIWSKRILIFSGLVWLLGAFFAFIAPLFF